MRKFNRIKQSQLNCMLVILVVVKNFILYLLRVVEMQLASECLIKIINAYKNAEFVLMRLFIIFDSMMSAMHS